MNVDNQTLVWALMKTKSLLPFSLICKTFNIKFQKYKTQNMNYPKMDPAQYCQISLLQQKVSQLASAKYSLFQLNILLIEVHTGIICKPLRWMLIKCWQDVDNYAKFKKQSQTEVFLQCSRQSISTICDFFYTRHCCYSKCVNMS